MLFDIHVTQDIQHWHEQRRLHELYFSRKERCMPCMRVIGPIRSQAPSMPRAQYSWPNKQLAVQKPHLNLEEKLYRNGNRAATIKFPVQSVFQQRISLGSKFQGVVADIRHCSWIHLICVAFSGHGHDTVRNPHQYDFSRQMSMAAVGNPFKLNCLGF